jgi:uncharacterized protein
VTSGRSLPSRAQRVTIYLSQTQRHGHVAVYVEIVARARAAGMAGATVIQGAEGFGRAGTLHRRHAMSRSEEPPVVVTVIDTPERIDAFLSGITELTSKATLVRRDLDVLRPHTSSRRW